MDSDESAQKHSVNNTNQDGILIIDDKNLREIT